MIRRILLTSLLFSSLVLAFSQPRFVHTRGTQILDPDGKPLILRGTNLGNWLVPEGYMFKFQKTTSPRLIDQTLKELIGPDETRSFWKKFVNQYIQEEDIQFLHRLGMNSIRVPFNYRIFTDSTYCAGLGSAGAFRVLDRLVGWCKKAHLYILLDMHCAPGGQTGDNIDDSYAFPFIYDSQESQQIAVEVWKKIAAHYRSEPTILGYDLLNEPISTSFDSAHFNPLLEPLFKKITHAIRQVDPNHLVFLEGAQWASNFQVFGPPFDAKAVYSFHKYWTSPTQDVIQSYLDFRDRYQVPVYCGETGENEDAWIRDFRVLLEKNQVGWHYWPYKKMDDSRGIVQFDKPSTYPLVSAYADSTKPDFEAIRTLRPRDRAAIRQALDGYLENCRFTHCHPNRGYIQALGLTLP